MPICDIAVTRSRWSFLSKIDTLGSLDFWTLTVSLDSLNPKETANLSVSELCSSESLSIQQYEKYAKVLTLATHEYTHYIDATSTVWGMQHLLKLEACLKVPLNDETQFYNLKKTYDHLRQIRLPDYYTVIEKNSNAEKPWSSEVTSGVMFNPDGSVGDRPVLFVRFWNAEKNLIARSPISLVSLLEASARANEIECRIRLVQRLQRDEALVEKRIINEKTLSYIYNPNFTEYSVCFHLLANCQNEKNIATVSMAVGLLTRLVLNFPDIAFITATKNIQGYANKMQLSLDSLEVMRLKRSLELRNHGAMFFLICTLLPQYSLRTMSIFWTGIEAALRDLGLTREKLRYAAYQEVEECVKRLSKSANGSIRKIANAGHSNFQTTYKRNFTYALEELALPPALHGDFTQYSFSNSEKNLLKSYDLDVGYDDLIGGQIRAEKFSEACR